MFIAEGERHSPPDLKICKISQHLGDASFSGFSAAGGVSAGPPTECKRCFYRKADSVRHLLMLTVLFLNHSQHKLSDIVAYSRFASHKPVY